MAPVVSIGLTVRCKVMTESQPTALVSVRVTSPEVVYVLPYHENDPHTVAVVSLDVELLTLNINVATESQPAAFVPVHM